MQPLWTKNFILICLSSLTMFIAFHSLIPTLPFYIVENGGGTSFAGLALGILTIAAIIIRPLTGWALDNYGRKKIFIGGLLLFLLPSVVYYWMVPVVMLLFLRFVQGLGWGICSTSSGTVASDIVPKEKMGEGMGYFGLTISISLATAPAIGLWLIGNYSFQVLFIICSLLSMLAIFFALVVKYPEIEKKQVKFKFAFVEKAALRPALVILFITITYSSLLSFLSLFVIEQGMDSGSVFVFFIVLASTSLISRPLSGRIIDAKGTAGYDFSIIVGVVAIIMAMLILTQTSTPLQLIAGGIFYGIGFGFTQPTMLALAINLVPANKRGGANATYWTAFDIGVASGSIIWGFVASTFGYSLIFKLSVIPAMIAIAIYFAGKVIKCNKKDNEATTTVSC